MKHLSLIILLAACTSCVSITERSEPWEKKVSSKIIEERGERKPAFEIIKNVPWTIHLRYKQYYDKVEVAKVRHGKTLIREWKTNHQDTAFESSIYGDIPGYCVIFGFPLFIMDFIRAADRSITFGTDEKRTIIEKSVRHQDKVITEGTIDLITLRNDRISLPINPDGIATINDAAIEAIMNMGCFNTVEVSHGALDIVQTISFADHPVVIKKTVEYNRIQKEIDKYILTLKDDFNTYTLYKRILSAMLKKHGTACVKDMIVDRMLQNAKVMTDKLDVQVKEKRLSNDMLSFHIGGEYREIGTNQIQIYGFAVPSDNNNSHEGAVFPHGNIILFTHYKPNTRGFYNSKSNYYLYKSYGENMYGGRVPVWYFTTQKSKKCIKTETEINELLILMQKVYEDTEAIKTVYKKNI